MYADKRSVMSQRRSVGENGKEIKENGVEIKESTGRDGKEERKADWKKE